LNYYGFNTSSNNNNYQNYSTTSHNSNQYPLTQSNNKKSILKNSPLTFPDWNKNNNSTTTFTNAQNKKFINILPAKNN
jgi:predicted AlkP superfamily phosphohydrolase/phosphomutase